MECDEFSTEKVLTRSDARRDGDGLLSKCGNLCGQLELGNRNNEVAHQVFCSPLPSCGILNVSCLEHRQVGDEVEKVLGIVRPWEPTFWLEDKHTSHVKSRFTNLKPTTSIAWITSSTADLFHVCHNGPLNIK